MTLFARFRAARVTVPTTVLHARDELEIPFSQGRLIASTIPNARLVSLDSRNHILVSIPLAILDFLCIHPFQDGNGRTARLLTLLLLYRNNYEVGHFISLERIIEESKETYYETLAASSQHWHDAKHDPFPWLRYFWGVLIRAYREFEERVGTISSTKGSKSDRVREAVLKQTSPFSISEIERLCPGVSRETVRNVLRDLKAAGNIESLGKGRSAKWSIIPRR